MNDPSHSTMFHSLCEGDSDTDVAGGPVTTDLACPACNAPGEFDFDTLSGKCDDCRLIGRRWALRPIDREFVVFNVFYSPT